MIKIMHISDGTLEKLLTQSKRFPVGDIAALKEESTRLHKPMYRVAIDKKMFDDATLTKMFADYSGIPLVTLDPKEIQPEVLNRIPERIARQYRAILFKIDDAGLMHLAMEDPDDVQAVDFIQKQIGVNTRTYIASHDNIEVALEGYHANVDKRARCRRKLPDCPNDQPAARIRHPL